jgi:hypothetical protein
MKVSRSLIHLVACACVTMATVVSTGLKSLSTAGTPDSRMHHHMGPHVGATGAMTTQSRTPGPGNRLDQLRLYASFGKQNNYVTDMIRHRATPASRLITNLRRGFDNVFSTIIASSTAAMATIARFGSQDIGDPQRSALFV